MPFVDTHVHLDQVLDKMGLPLEHLAQLRDGMMEVSFDEELGVVPEYSGCVTIGCSARAIPKTEALLRQGVEGVYGAYGIHPLSAGDWDAEMRDRLVRLYSDDAAVVAWGECGLDYHYVEDEEARATQRRVFQEQLEVVAELGAPLIIHTREAEEDTLALLKGSSVPRTHRIHVHSFSSKQWLAEALMDEYSSLYIGMTGIVTFKNAPAVRATARAVPLSRLLLETDGPYLAPTPHRGAVAHPGFIPRIAEQIAQVKEVSVEEVYTAARENTRNMYGI